MSDREQPYDPYIPAAGNDSQGAGEASQGTAGNQRTAALQAQIDDTVGVMRDNINKVSQRGERLDALQDKTDNLAVSAQGFRRGANRVRKQMWWKDMRMRICIIVGIILLLVVIIVPSVITSNNNSSQPSDNNNNNNDGGNNNNNNNNGGNNNRMLQF